MRSRDARATQRDAPCKKTNLGPSPERVRRRAHLQNDLNGAAATLRRWFRRATWQTWRLTGGGGRQRWLI